MRQFNVLLVKEMREIWRSFKLIWVPLVFLSLGVSDPLVNYFIEDIMSAVGNLPEGYEILFQDMPPEAIISASAGQFQSIGLIILMALTVGAISRERQNGTAALLYVRPLSFSALYASKLVATISLSIVSVLLGYAGSVYYTVLLYGEVDWTAFAQLVAIHMVWLLFVLSFTLTMSALCRTAVAAAISFTFIIGGTLVDQLIGSFWVYSPWKLMNYGIALLQGDVNMSHVTWTIVITVVCISVFIAAGIVATRNQRNKILL